MIRGGGFEGFGNLSQDGVPEARVNCTWGTVCSVYDRVPNVGGGVLCKV